MSDIVDQQLESWEADIHNVDITSADGFRRSAVGVWNGARNYKSPDPDFLAAGARAVQLSLKLADEIVARGPLYKTADVAPIRDEALQALKALREAAQKTSASDLISALDDPIPQRAAPMFAITLNAFHEKVWAAYCQYARAELALSRAYLDDGRDLSECAAEQAEAKQKAMQLAIALHGLLERVRSDQRVASMAETRDGELMKAIAPGCRVSGTFDVRPGCLERIRAISAADRHHTLNDSRHPHPIASEDDILATGVGFGLDQYGVGKYGGAPEVFVTDKGQLSWKFIADADAAVHAWAAWLAAQGSPVKPLDLKYDAAERGDPWEFAR